MIDFGTAFYVITTVIWVSVVIASIIEVRRRLSEMSPRERAEELKYLFERDHGDW
jgi:hypothetical protein